MPRYPYSRFVQQQEIKRDAMLRDHELNECPQSFITARSMQLVQISLRAKRMNRTLGETMFGPDASQWPGWAGDAVNVIEIEDIRVDNALHEAMKVQ